MMKSPRKMMSWIVAGSRPPKVHLSSKSLNNKTNRLQTRKKLVTKETLPMPLRLLDNGVSINGLPRPKLMRNEYFLSIIFSMQGRKSNGLSVFADTKADHLRKIEANDRFPCFACFDDQK